MEQGLGMWRQGVLLDTERTRAWLDELAPICSLATDLIGANAVAWSLGPVGLGDVAGLLGEGESVATAVFAALEEGRGLLMLATSLSAPLAMHAATTLFENFSAKLGEPCEEPWMLIDMRSALGETLAAQTACLRLAVMATAKFGGADGAVFAFIPDWDCWPARAQLELEKEAA